MNATKNRIAIQEYKHNGQFVAGTNTDEHLYAFDRQALEQAVRAVNSYDELLADREYMKRYREAYCHQVTVIQAMREALELAVVLHPHNVTFTKALALANGSSGRGMKRNPHPRRRP